MLREARPDLTPAEREDRLAPFVGALNASADMRVLDARVQGEEAVVTILGTYVIVNGRQDPRAPVEETLYFSRQGDGWRIQPQRGPGRP